MQLARRVWALAVLSAAGCGVDAAQPLDLGGLDARDAANGAGGDGGAPLSATDQIIYLVLLDRFQNGEPTNDTLGLSGCFDAADPQKYHGGDLAGLTQRLPYLTELGVNTLWVTPLYRQSAGPPGRCGYHGYWADFVDPDDAALEPRLGTSADFLGLVDGAHRAGMHVILDMVVNHAGDHAQVWAQHPDWFHDPSTCASLGDPAIYCPYRPGIHDFAQERPEVATYLAALAAGWVRRFGVDGIRMDTAKYVLPAYFHDSFLPAVRAVRPLFVVAEVFSEAPADLSPYLDAGFDSTFNFPLRRAFVDAFAKGGSVALVAAVLEDELGRFGLARLQTLVTLLDNHDVPRFVNEPGVAVAPDEIRRRHHLALAALFTVPGIPQLYAGDELGLYGGQDPDNRRDMPPWAWASAERGGTFPGAALPNPEATFAHVQKLIALRKAHAALSRGSYVELWRPSGSAANLFAFFRGSGDSRVLVLLHDGTAASGPLVVPLAPAPAARAALADGVVLDEQLGAGAPAAAVVSQGALRLDLDPKVAAIYAPRRADAGAAVSFHVRAPAPAGVIAIAGSTDELGRWDPARAVALTPSACDASGCDFSATLRVLPFGQTMQLKFVQIAGTQVTWENGANRTFTVPAAATASYDGGSFR